MSEIEIIEGHNSSSYFWIMPVRIIDNNKNTDDIDNVEEYRKLEISIEEDYVERYLFPILLKYFDDELDENVKRNIKPIYLRNGQVTTFEWNLSYNYYNFDAIRKMIQELKSVNYSLIENYINSQLDYIKKDYEWIFQWDTRIEAQKLPTEENARIKFIKSYMEMIINFYNRIIHYLEKMIEEGEKEGYNLISFMGP